MLQVALPPYTCRLLLISSLFRHRNQARLVFNLGGASRDPRPARAQCTSSEYVSSALTAPLADTRLVRLFLARMRADPRYEAFPWWDKINNHARAHANERLAKVIYFTVGAWNS